MCHQPRQLNIRHLRAQSGDLSPPQIRAACGQPESLAVGPLVQKEGAWPRKNEELSKRNREDGNQAYQEEQ